MDSVAVTGFGMEIGIGADGWLWSFRQSPPTPPDIRVRIRRFGRLRLAGKPWYSDPVEVAVRQRGVQSDVSGRPPPAFAVGGDLRGRALRETSGAQFTEDLCAPLPLFELDHSESSANPGIEVLKTSGRLIEAEVFPPPGQVAPQLRHHYVQASPSGPTSNLSDTSLHRCKGRRRNTSLDLSSLSVPETVAEKFAVLRPRHRALRLVDLQPEMRVQPPKRLHGVFPRPLGPDVHVQVVGVTDETEPAPLQLLVHFVEEHVCQQR